MLAETLDNLTRQARAAGLSDTEWAARAGVRYAWTASGAAVRTTSSSVAP